VRLLELLGLSVVASAVFTATAVAAMPAAPAAVVGSPRPATLTTPPLERPVLVRLPDRAVSVAPVAAVVVRPARPLTRPVRAAVTTHASPVVAAPRAAVVTRAAGDAYPYRTSQTDAHDAWGFTQRQCVSYAAWRLAEAGHAISNDRDGWGSASGWDDTARRLGLVVDATPTVGAIAHWDAGESSTAWVGSARGTFTAGGYGHVGYVTQVFADGSVQVAQYNATGNRAFSTMRLSAPRFLHIP
jgi:surface antigen